MRPEGPWQQLCCCPKTASSIILQIFQFPSPTGGVPSNWGFPVSFSPHPPDKRKKMRTKQGKETKENNNP